jgi:hypothetical protein
MFVLVLYLLIGPLAIIWLVMWFFKRYGKRTIPAGIARLYEEKPPEPKTFRLVRFDGSTDGTPMMLGDFDSQPEAVDAAYAYRQKERAEEPGVRSSLFVLNDKGEFLEEVDT